MASPRLPRGPETKDLTRAVTLGRETADPKFEPAEELSPAQSITLSFCNLLASNATLSVDFH